MNLCISVVSVVMSPPFIIPLTFFMVSIVKHLSILLIVHKKPQLLVLLILTIAFLVSVLFLSTLVYVISFFLLIFGSVCSGFLAPWGVTLGLFEIFIFFFITIYHHKFITINFSRASLAGPHKFGHVLSSFSFVLRYF